MLVADTLVVIGLATVGLGTIHEVDGLQEHAYWLRNGGAQPVTITQGYTSCGCTTIDFAKDKAIAPGDSTCIMLHFNPRGKGGEFRESGTVVYGRERKRVELVMEGTCITSEETLMKQFPVRVTDQIRLSADRYDLGIMHVGETRERGVAVLYRDEGNRTERIAITFTADKQTGKGLQHIAYPITVGSGNRKETVNITLDVIIK